MIHTLMKKYNFALWLYLGIAIHSPSSIGQELKPAVIIAPARLSSVLSLPVVVQVKTGQGTNDTSVSGSYALETDYAYFTSNQLSIKNGVGSILTTVEASNDFDISLDDLSGGRKVLASISLPIAHHDDAIVSGLEVWTASEEHHVSGNLTVLSTGEIKIEAGTTIIMGEKSNMTVYGTVTAEGTQDKPITFIARNADTPWGGLEVRKGTGSFAFCFFVQGGADSLKCFGHSGSQPALKAYEGELTVSECYFFDNIGKAIGGYNSVIDLKSSLVSRCDTGGEFINCSISVTDSYFTDIPSEDDSRVDDDNDFLYFNGVYPGTEEPVLVRDCFFVNGYDDGIDILASSVNITNNVFFGLADKAISIGGAAKNVTISRNVIAGTNIAVAVKDESVALIDHSTIDDTETGVSAYVKGEFAQAGGTVIVTNSILSRCHSAVLNYDSQSSITVQYTLSDSELLTGTGNVTGEPLFVSVQDRNYHLQMGSPAIDAGDPGGLFDNDGSRNDIGAYSFNKMFAQIVINEINYNSLDTHDPGDWVELYNPNDFTVDLSGWIFRDSNIEHAYVFPYGFMLAPDSYIVLCANQAMFSAIFPDVATNLYVMDFGLSAAGELIRLIDSTGMVVDSLTYDDKPPWPVEPDGGGSTLALINPELDNALSKNWKSSEGYGTPGKINDTFRYYDRARNEIVTSVVLEQNYPNPFNLTTTIPFILPESGHVKIELYSVTGQKITTLVDDTMSSGHYEVPVSLTDVSSGVYLYRIMTEKTSKTKSMLIIK